ncbi:kinase [Nocardia asteroides]|uniref:kinase n=1 Tax=Nocardia asteroides TaxID=1824 RepID=UPI001E4012E5|nr:kinase [Nocardia asteroides]UGT63413.1 kinase [Nocardia asteroides]
MTDQGVLLYGPPASGKDTVTAYLSRTDRRYQLYRRLKVGSGRTESYRMTTAPALDHLAATDQIIWENRRYGSRYAIERSSIELMIRQGQIPVIHAGQPEIILAIQNAFPVTTWITVELTCPRDIALKRIVARDTGDTYARLAAWDATPRLHRADLVLDTSLRSPSESADSIRRVVES